MATTDILSVPSTAYDITAGGDVTTGGTSLGEALSVMPLALQKQFELHSRQSNASPQPDRVREFGIDGVLSIILAERSAAVMSLAFPGYVRSGDGKTVQGAATLPGQFVTSFRKLVVRPNDPTTYPSEYLYMPAVYVSAIGPIQWARRPGTLQLEAMQLTCYAMFDATAGVPWVLGKPAEFP